ncbi:hypothetical protein RHMOL_Rhmol04G0260200 [Rhododendron molle]|uniref:Uncharacterized protein n=1 Tax=Rhododendron molle TaxID=49168 RepID=A0ACC0P5K4_RHOML|nr:hypothetical protein RHMOL_Rhmol04G0260200 [Rhododendron molle]
MTSHSHISSPMSNRSADASWSPRGSLPSSLSSKHSPSKPKPRIQFPAVRKGISEEQFSSKNSLNSS